MEIRGIDVSHWQGKPDWSKIKTSGIEFAILNVLSSKLDTSFEYNYSGCIRYGIAVGAYAYSYATSVDIARKEAALVIKALEGKEISYPVFYDLEWDKIAALGKTEITNIAEAFLQEVFAAGYKVGIYCNVNWYNSYISEKLKQKYDFWIAAVPANDTGVIKESIRPGYGIGWQYSWKGKIPGMDEDVDLNVFYKDFTNKSSVDTIILVIDGSFGPACTHRSQQWAGTDMDGIISNQPAENKKYLHAAYEVSWQFLASGYNAGSSFVRVLQRVLKDRGYLIGLVDGWCGKTTVTAWQKWLTDEGYYKGAIDGSMGAEHVKAWQRYLNTH